ncbi:MAG TPA: NAD(P)-dependent oxidoreductase [Gaiellaceae bacterium]|nr:NAD(P)-dependent oxidoreductase [Gaiellaceae bacterium]
MRVVVTGARGFLGSRVADLLEEHGHQIVRVSRPDGASRALAGDAIQLDAGDPAARDLLAGADAVLHFAGVPDPARSRSDPAWAVRQNAGTTLNLLEGCLEHGCGLIFPSTVRAALDPPPDPYALSKRLGEETCRLHPAPATVVRLTSVFGPGQVAHEGATGAIAAFAARALAGEPIVIPGDPERMRDFVYVDDLVPALERIVTDDRWNETLSLASGVETPLRRAAELVRDAVGSDSPIETPGGALEPGENLSYSATGAGPTLGFGVRPLQEAIPLYVDWLRRHPTAQSRSRA